MKKEVGLITRLLFLGRFLWGVVLYVVCEMKKHYIFFAFLTIYDKKGYVTACLLLLPWNLLCEWLCIALNAEGEGHKK